MPIKEDLAEEAVNKYGAVLRDPSVSRDDRRQRLQDIIEKTLEKYGEIVASGVARQRREHSA